MGYKFIGDESKTLKKYGNLKPKHGEIYRGDVFLYEINTWYAKVGDEPIEVVFLNDLVSKAERYKDSSSHYKTRAYWQRLYDQWEIMNN